MRRRTVSVKKLGTEATKETVKAKETKRDRLQFPTVMAAAKATKIRIPFVRKRREEEENARKRRRCGSGATRLKPSRWTNRTTGVTT